MNVNCGFWDVLEDVTAMIEEKPAEIWYAGDCNYGCVMECSGDCTEDCGWGSDN